MSAPAANGSLAMRGYRRARRKLLRLMVRLKIKPDDVE
jgi:hypothetical protein